MYGCANVKHQCLSISLMFIDLTTATGDATAGQAGGCVYLSQVRGWKSGANPAPFSFNQPGDH